MKCSLASHTAAPAPSAETARRLSWLRSTKSGLLAWSLIAVFTWTRVAAADLPPSWVGTWATSPRAEDPAAAAATLEGVTLRQIVHVSIGGSKLRLRLSNVFGATALSLHGVHLAAAGLAGSIRAGTDRPLLFHGQSSVAIPAGASLLSDPLDFDLPAMSDVAISIYFKSVPAMLTTHPGSRTTSYVLAGDQLAAPELPAATKNVHWFFINGLDVLDSGGQPAAAVALLGDSITDGYGCTTDANNRWTDELARRLQANPATCHIGVLNEGIGGNRLLRDGLGPNALARFDRDVLCQSGVRWLIVLEGINDLGTRAAARAKGETFASAADVIAAYDEMIERAHTHGIRVIGATLLPFGGSKNYWSIDGDADRQTINGWIRASRRFDAVIDFDATLRSPEEPDKLKPNLDCGDHLHPSVAGYAEMARGVDLALFKN